jgi:hypothetical protein
MIDDREFKSAWAMLCERFGKQFSKAMVSAYYNTLSPKLTTAEFKASALRRTNLDVLPHVRREFLQLYGDAATIARREAGERIAPTKDQLKVTAPGMAKRPGLSKVALVPIAGPNGADNGK